jgi:hypothetical protein
MNKCPYCGTPECSSVVSGQRSKDCFRGEIGLLKERVKRLEQMGDLMRWWCADSESVDHWDKAKEAKP